MKINRKVLLEALDAVMPGIANKEVIEQSGSFVFTNGRVFSYNDEVAVSHPIKLDLEGAIPAKAFRALVNKVKTEEISLTINKGELLLTGSKAKAGLRLETEINLPLEEVGMPTKWIELPEKFCDAVQFCLFSASKDESKAVLTCLHITNEYVESCDNYRITQFYLSDPDEESKYKRGYFPEELLIPAFAAKDIAKNSPVEYAATEGWLHFRNGKDATYSCRYMDAEYPDFEPFLECDGDAIVFPETLNEILDRADVFSNGERVSIIMEDDELIVCTENESGWFEECCKISNSDDEKMSRRVRGAAGVETLSVEFDIQPEFMKSLLKFKGEASISDKVLRFDSNSFIHVVQLLAPKKK